MNAPADYWAFLSYSHRDRRWADWLHGALERYRVPGSLVGRSTATGTVPERLNPIFRDREELAASDDLGDNIRAALASAKFLIVLCSPAAAQSRWTNEEIATFKRLHPDRRVLAAIVAGEPHASDIPGREPEECFPDALRHRFGPDGERTEARAEPIAADFRKHADGRRMGLLKLVAGMLGVGLDELARRDSQRRQKRLTWLAAASVAGMTVTSGLAVAAVEARDEAREQRQTAIDARDEARSQRREAEGLIEYMLTDLRQKLEPVGRLEVLDGVGQRALTYYSRQDLESLDAASLGKRSRALHLIGEVRSLQGDLSGALAVFKQAALSTSEQLRRQPDDPQRIYDHAQSVFWVGDVAWQRRDLDTAEQAFVEYRRLADRLVSINPSSAEWQAELGYAHSNLGTLFLETERPVEAISHFRKALEIKLAAAAAAPGDRKKQLALGQSHAWLATAAEGAGDLGEALRLRVAERQLHYRLSSGAQNDADIIEPMVVNAQVTARLRLARGEAGSAIEEARRAVRLAESLNRRDPSNAFWSGLLVRSRVRLSETLMFTDPAAADTEASRAVAHAGTLAAKDPSNSKQAALLWEAQIWRGVLLERRGRRSEAVGTVRRLRPAILRASQAEASTRTFKPLLAWTWLIECGALSEGSVATPAPTACREALQSLDGGARTDPAIGFLRYAALRRLGDGRAAEQARLGLASSGYRHPLFQRL